jgi:transposase
MAYSSSLNDQEWDIFEPLLLKVLPQKKKTRPPEWTKREIIDGILYQLKNGCPKGFLKDISKCIPLGTPADNRFAYNWEDLPKDLPPYSTVYWHYKQWREVGVLEELMRVLHG